MSCTRILAVAFAHVVFAAAVVVAPTSAEAAPPTATPDRLGEQRTLVIPMFVPIAAGFSPTDCVGQQVNDYKVTPRVTATQLSLALASSTELDFFYRASTYGKTLFDFEVLANPDPTTDANPADAMTADGWWRAPNTLNTYCTKKSLFVGAGSMVEDAVTGIYQNAIRSGLAPPPDVYRRIVVVVNKDSWGGATYRGFPTYSLAAKGAKPSSHTVSASLVNENGSDQSLRTVLRHELGHQLRLSAHYYGQVDNPVTPANERIPCPLYATAVQVECLGPWDPMADSGWGTEFSAYSRVEAGWLPDNGSYVVSLPPIGGPDPIGMTVGMPPLEADENELSGTVRLRYRAVRVPILTTSPFKGYYIECRRRTGFDSNRLDATGTFTFGLPADGVLITYVDEPNEPRLFAVRAHGLEDLFGAPLQPGESFATTPVNGSQLVIRNNGDVRAGAGPPFCSVTFKKKPAHLHAAVGLLGPDVAANGGIENYRSGDIWVDASNNGIGRFPASQKVHRESGVPTPLGPGDRPHPGKPNHVWFRVRNSGSASARRLLITVRYGRSPLGSCRSRLLGSVRIASLAPGRTALRSLAWVPHDSQGRLEVRLTRAQGDATAGDDLATTNFATLPALTLRRKAAATTIRLPAADGCVNPKGLTAQLVGLPRGWNASLSPALIGRRVRELHVRVRANVRGVPARPFAVVFTRLKANGPHPTPPGAPQGFEDDPFLGREQEPAEGVILLAQLARRSTLSLTCPRTVGINEPIAVKGTVSPRLAGAPIQLEYRHVSGAVRLGRRLTTRDGRFADSFAVRLAGRWALHARWSGDAAHLPAVSPSCSIRVIRQPHRSWANLVPSDISARSVTIRNIGNAPAGTFVVIASVPGRPPNGISVSGLAVSAMVTLPLRCALGITTITVDALNSIAEGPFEADNDAEKRIESCNMSRRAALKQRQLFDPPTLSPFLRMRSWVDFLSASLTAHTPRARAPEGGHA